MTTTTITAQQRLAASRQAIVRDMHRDNPEIGQLADVDADVDAQSAISETGIDASSSSWDLVKQVGQSWWRSHPARLAVDVAKPMMQTYAKERPLKLLGIAAGTGIALVVLRPWRLISLTGVAIALLKSTQLAGVVQSLILGPHEPDRSHPHRRPR
ncbi:MAG: hypothetical protein Q8O29_03260 [Polaromonas sp.]|uniref:hypothetical protein n=1 Tax=Polaromonas sp. TaxID=1869339 RepID=UPI002732EFCD|nr:hypothetical protein [Polaromonas sp.]MDP2817294.1 hypothetical protein [Polaromonas sp.]